VLDGVKFPMGRGNFGDCIAHWKALSLLRCTQQKGSVKPR